MPQHEDWFDPCQGFAVNEVGSVDFHPCRMMVVMHLFSQDKVILPLIFPN